MHVHVLHFCPPASNASVDAEDRAHWGMHVHARQLCLPAVRSVSHGSKMGCWVYRAGADLDAVDQGRVRGFPALAQVVGDLLALGEDARIPERRQPLQQGVAAQLQAHRPVQHRAGFYCCRLPSFR